MGKNILASSSPRRADILKDKFNFEIVPSPYEEIHSTTVFSYEYVENLAYNKAKAVVPLVDNDCIIIGADTVVVLDNKIMEKPVDINDAKRMLKELSNLDISNPIFVSNANSISINKSPNAYFPK